MHSSIPPQFALNSIFQLNFEYKLHKFQEQSTGKSKKSLRQVVFNKIKNKIIIIQITFIQIMDI